MRKFKRLVKGFYQLLLPIFVLIGLVATIASIALVYTLADPPKSRHLVTPAKFAQLSSRGAKVTEETWQNTDGTEARGWLLKGDTGNPAVLLLHKYGTDRSHVLNLGVKLNETTNFTVLMPDLRGHGNDPLVRNTGFGGAEIEDIVSAIGFLRGLKVRAKKDLVGKDVGIYGVELGALVGLSVGAKDTSIKAIALDSVPKSSDNLLASITESRFPFASFITSRLAKGGAYLFYAMSSFERTPSCEIAKNLFERKVLLLAGPNSPGYQTSTSNLGSCFPKSTDTKAFTSLTPSGFNLTKATLAQVDSYDQRVIYFFKENLEKK